MDGTPEEQARNRGGNPPPEHRFPPGVSGNPGGRPKGRSLTAIIREVLDSNTIKGMPLPEGRTVADVLGEVFIVEALKGKFRFAKEVIDRVDGKVPEKHEHTGDGGGPMRLVFEQAAAKVFGRPTVEAETTGDNPE